MDKLFENNYIMNREWAKDVFAYISFRRPFMVAFDIYLLLCIILGVIGIITDENFNVSLFILPIAWVILKVYLYFKNVNVKLKRDLEVHGKPIEITMIVTEDNITMIQSTGSEIRLNYEDIKKAFQTKKYIYLQSKTNLLYSFKKDGFCIGNYVEFLKFLSTKGIKAK